MSSISSNLTAPPNNFSTTLSGSITSTGLTIGLNSVTGLATEGVGAIFKKDTAGDVIDSSVEIIHWTNVSGSNLTLTNTGDRGLSGSYGAAAQAHDSGDYFEVWVTSQYYDSLRSGFVAEHSTAGVHDSTKVPVVSGGNATTLTTTGATNVTLPTTGTLASLAGTETLTNKRVTPRIATVADAATITPTADSCDEYTVTALAQAATIAAPSGTPTNGQKLIIRILDNGTGRALTFNAIYKVVGVTLPTTTVANKYIYIGCIYSTADTKWHVLAVQNEA